jgi:phosphorylcholine metabolism protein LicD
MPYDYSSSAQKRILRKFVRSLFSFLSVNRLHLLLQKEMMRYQKEKTDFVCSMASHYSYQKQCMPKEVYGNPVLVDFENSKFYAPQDTIGYLKRIYGNYEKLPPLSEQEKARSYFVSFQIPSSESEKS